LEYTNVSLVAAEYCNCLLTPQDPEDDEEGCPDHYNIWMTFLGILIFTHIMDIIFAITSFVYIQSMVVSAWGGRSSFTLQGHDDKRKCGTKCILKMQSTFQCCVVGGIEGFVPGGDLAEMSLVMFHYFQGQDILDLTPSDIFAALLMVERLHMQERAVERVKLIMMANQNPVEPKNVNASVEEEETIEVQEEIAPPTQEQMVVAEGARFIDMAQSVCTWSLTQTVGSLRTKYPIIYSQRHTDFPKTPYVIAFDHESKSIVVVISLTQSLEELLNEIFVEPKELEPLGGICGFDGKNKYCNANMLASAEWIYQDLQGHGMLQKLQEDASSAYHSYQLMVIGQSVGAGIASVLSLLLRPSFPNVRCLAFSPPGCVFSSNVDCSEWVLSYVLDSDSEILPRLSADSFDAFRKELLETFCRIKVPKYRVLRRDRYHVGDQTLADLKLINETMLCAKEDILDTEFKAQVDEYQNDQDQARSVGSTVKLILPGKIVQIYRSKDTPGSFERSLSPRSLSSRRYFARWVELEDLSKINITGEFLSEHDPDRLRKALSRLVPTSFGSQKPFPSENILTDVDSSTPSQSSPTTT
jgi:hypothetical protein